MFNRNLLLALYNSQSCGFGRESKGKGKTIRRIKREENTGRLQWEELSEIM